MPLMHNVFFTLKDRSPEAVKKLLDACKRYLTIQPGILTFSAGVRDEGLARSVNDTEWDVGLHILFKDRASHDAYQDDATHTRFVDEMKPNWAKVRVFDSLA
jgi:hypothetical protein